MSFEYSFGEIRDAANRCIQFIDGKKVIAFHGAMGTGKTTLIHAICDQKQVTSAVSSPTFALINEYNSPAGSIFHIDLYRLNDEEEAVRAGVEDCLYSGKMCFVEWPEKIPSLIPPKHASIDLQVENNSKRTIVISFHDGKEENRI